MTDVSPDAPPVVTPGFVEELTEDEMLDLAISIIQANSPEWTPRAGSQEVVFLEALVMLVTSTNYALSQVAPQVVEDLLALHGVRRDPGGPARGVARFEVAPGQTVRVIPAGTVVRAQLPETGETAEFTSTGDLRIESQETVTGTVEIVATEPGAHLNGIPAGTNLELADNLTFVERVTLATATAGGRAAETDQSLDSRAAARFGRMTETLVLPDHFQLAAIEREEVGRSRVLDLYDPTNEDSAPGDSAGHVTVVVADNDGQPLTPAQRRRIADDLAYQALASLVIHVEDPDYTDVEIELSVEADPDANPEAVKEAVTTRIARWLSPAAWPWGGTVEQFSLVAEVSAVPGVARVLIAPPNISLSGYAPLPRVQNISIDVRGGLTNDA